MHKNIHFLNHCNLSSSFQLNFLIKPRCLKRFWSPHVRGVEHFPGKIHTLNQFQVNKNMYLRAEVCKSWTDDHCKPLQHLPDNKTIVGLKSKTERNSTI